MKEMKLVRIGNSLRRTKERYGTNSYMERMKNKIFKVTKDHDGSTSIIYDKNSKSSYTFSNDDIKNDIGNDTEDLPPIPNPKIFNPAELDI